MKLVYLVLGTVIGLSKSDRTALVEKAVSIANDVYEPFLLTTVAWWDHDHEHINEFLLKYAGTVRTTRVKECFEKCLKKFTPKQTVFFANKPEEFDKFLAVSNDVTVEAVIVILIIVNENFTSDVINYTKIAMKRDVIDIVVISTKLDNTIAVSTIIPYRIGTCADFSPIEVTGKVSNIFKESKYTNFHRCPIRVTAIDIMPYVKVIRENNSIIDIRGIDGSVLKLVIERLNATMDVVSVSDHDLGYYTNGTAVGSFGNLFYNKADIMVPALIMTTRRYPAAQITSVYRRSYIILCLPKRKEIHKCLKILLPFYNLATPSILAAALGIYCTLRLIRIFEERENDLPQGIVYGLYSLFFGHFYNVNSKNWLINSLFVSWIWCSLVFRISYEGRLVEGLHHITLEPPVKNIEEAIKAVNEVRIHSTIMEFYKNTPIEKYGVPIKLPDMVKTLYEISDGRNILLAMESGLARMHKRNVQVLHNHIITAPSCLFLRPRFPAAKYVSHVLLRIIATGQIDKIIDDFTFGWVLHNSNKTVTLHAEPLGMKILGSCFLGLSVMYVVCFVILGSEVFINYITRRKLIPLPFTH